MTTTLVLPEQVAAQIEAAAKHPLETAALLLVSHLVAADRSVRLLARHQFRKRRRLSGAGQRPALHCIRKGTWAPWRKRIGREPFPSGSIHIPGEAGVPVAGRHDDPGRPRNR